MKIVLIPIFKFLFALGFTLVELICYLFVLLIILLWSFRIIKWSELNNNIGKMETMNGYIDDDKHFDYREDKNIIKTFIKYYKLWNGE